jgi:tight adherence protein C
VIEVVGSAVLGVVVAVTYLRWSHPSAGTAVIGLRPTLVVGRAIGHRLAPGSRQSVASSLKAAGIEGSDCVDIAIGRRALAAGAGLWVSVVVMVVDPVGLPRSLAIAPLVGSLVVPMLLARRRVERRRRSMATDLPRHLDLLALSVEAGLGFDQALARVSGALPGPLSAEFSRMQGEVAAGVPRSTALRAMSLRCPLPEIRTFIAALVQSESFGVPIGPLLRTHAADIRIRQRQAAQLRAQKAPVKMLVPMILCVFPALLVVVAGPALLTIRQTLLA